MVVGVIRIPFPNHQAGLNGGNVGNMLHHVTVGQTDNMTKAPEAGLSSSMKQDEVKYKLTGGEASLHPRLVHFDRGAHP